MKAAEFRRLALALPETEEGAHGGHADFRVGGKVFASLGPDEDWGMVRLPPEEQVEWTETQADVFEAFPGAWGRHGCTKVLLARARTAAVRKALSVAWRARAPRRLARQHEDKLP